LPPISGALASSPWYKWHFQSQAIDGFTNRTARPGRSV
jgi:hypothetical protein